MIEDLIVPDTELIGNTPSRLTLKKLELCGDCVKPLFVSNALRG